MCLSLEVGGASPPIKRFGPFPIHLLSHWTCPQLIGLMCFFSCGQAPGFIIVFQMPRSNQIASILKIDFGWILDGHLSADLLALHAILALLAMAWKRQGVMNAYAGNGDEITCMRLFQEMCQRQLGPTMTTYSIMMK